MSLNAREHVEAVAIMRRLLEALDRPLSEGYEPEWAELSPGARDGLRRAQLVTARGPSGAEDADAAAAAEQWLAENHPAPNTYVQALAAGYRS